MGIKEYEVRIDSIKEEIITVKARSEAEALEKAEELTLSSSLTGINISGISKHYVTISTGNIKKSKNQIIINAWFVFLKKVW